MQCVRRGERQRADDSESENEDEDKIDADREERSDETRDCSKRGNDRSQINTAKQRDTTSPVAHWTSRPARHP